MGLFNLFKKTEENEDKFKVQSKENEDAKPISSVNYEFEYNDKNVEIEEIRLTKELLEKINSKFISFDVETTGLDTYEDRIIELGAAIFENGKVTKTFDSLVNPNRLNPLNAMNVNNISNEMIKNARNEDEVYKDFIDFIGKESLEGNIIFCAHNGYFDLKFLSNTLSRLGYKGKIKFIDTLKLARNSIYDIENYKLGTITEYFGLINNNAHRAFDDAKICGEILIKLIPYVERKNEQFERKIEQQNFSDQEMIVCSYIQNILNKKHKNMDFLKYEKVSDNSISCKYLYNFLKFKVSKEGIYFIIKKDYAKDINLTKNNASLSEGGIEYQRVYISKVDDIDKFESYILNEYESIYNSAMDYIDNKQYKIDRVNEFMLPMKSIEINEMHDYLNKVDEIEIPIVNVKITENIDRNLVKINPINNRKNIKQINNKTISFYEDIDLYVKEMGRLRNICLKADEYMQQKGYDNAINLLDKVREEGYLTGDLYRRYIKIYHQLKDYDNEIDILEEAIPIMKRNNEHILDLKTKLQNAINLKYKYINDLKIKEEKEIKKNQIKEEKKKLKLAEKEKLKSNKKTFVDGRKVVQMDDNGNIIKEYISIAEAVRETGVNSKSIRDAAKGVQKHAGGYCWHYVDIEENIK